MTVDWPGPADPADVTRPAGTTRFDPGTQSTTDVPQEPRRSWSGLPALTLAPLAALAWWVVGFLPWLLDGLGRSALSQAGLSRLAVPLLADQLSSLVVGCGAGGLAAGFVALLGRGHLGWRVAAVTGGVAVAVAATLVRSRGAVRVTDSRVVDGLTVLVVVVSLVALMVGLLCLGGRVGLGLALAALAGTAPVWLTSVLYQAGLDGPGAYEHVDQVARWTGAAVLAAALVALGVRPLVRLVGWPVAVLLAWVVGPTATAAAYAEQLLRPGAGFGTLVGENVSATLQVWRTAASPFSRPLEPWVVAVVVGALVAVVLDRRRTSRDPAP